MRTESQNEPNPSQLAPTIESTEATRKRPWWLVWWPFVTAVLVVFLVILLVNVTKKSDQTEPEASQSHSTVRTLPEYVVFQTDTDQFRTGAVPICVRFSPNGRQVLIGTYGGYFRLMECQEGSQKAAFSHPKGRPVPVNAVEWSAAGNLAYIAIGKDLIVQDFTSMSACELYVLPDSAECISASDNGQWIAIAGRDGVVQIRASSEPEKIAYRWTMNGGLAGLFGVGRPRIKALRFSPDSKSIVAATDNGQVQKRTLGEKKDDWSTTIEFNDESFLPSSLRIVEDSSVCICIGTDSEHQPALVRIDQNSGAITEQKRLDAPRPGMYVNEGALNADGSLAAFRTGESLIVYELSSGRLIRYEETGGVDSLEFAPDGKHVVVAGDFQIQLLDAEEISTSGKQSKHMNRRIIEKAVWSDDSRRIFTFQRHGVIAAWNLGSLEIEWETQLGVADAQEIYSFGFAVTGDSHDIVASTSSEVNWADRANQLAFLNSKTGEIRQIVSLSSDERFTNIVPFANGSCLFTHGGLDPLVRIVDSGIQPTEITSVDRSDLASSDIGTVQTLSDGERLLVLLANGDIVEFSRQDHSTRLVSSVTFLFEEEYESLPVWLKNSHFTSAQFSSDGKTLVAANWFGAEVWDVDSGKSLSLFRDGFEPHRRRTAGISLDGQIIAIAESDYDNRTGELRFIDVSTGHELLIIPLRFSRPESLDFSPDGQQLLAVMDTGNAVVYEVPEAP